MYSNSPFTATGNGFSGPSIPYNQTSYLNPQQTSQQHIGHGPIPANSPAQSLATRASGFTHASNFGPSSQTHPSTTGANQSQSFNARPIQPVATGRQVGGQTSSEIAQSFSATEPPPPATQSNATLKIPNDRLSFLTLEDQIKFTNLFKSAVGDEQTLEGQSPATYTSLQHAPMKLMQNR